MWLLAVGLLAFTNAFAPVAVRPTHTSAFSRVRCLSRKGSYACDKIALLIRAPTVSTQSDPTLDDSPLSLGCYGCTGEVIDHDQPAKVQLRQQCQGRAFGEGRGSRRCQPDQVCSSDASIHTCTFASHNSKRGLIHRAYALGWGHRGGSVAAPMMPEMKAPSMQTQEIKLEDRGQTVSSRFRAEVGPQTCHTCVPRDPPFHNQGLLSSVLSAQTQSNTIYPP